MPGEAPRGDSPRQRPQDAVRPHRGPQRAHAGAAVTELRVPSARSSVGGADPAPRSQSGDHGCPERRHRTVLGGRPRQPACGLTANRPSSQRTAPVLRAARKLRAAGRTSSRCAQSDLGRFPFASSQLKPGSAPSGSLGALLLRRRGHGAGWQARAVPQVAVGHRPREPAPCGRFCLHADPLVGARGWWTTLIAPSGS